MNCLTYGVRELQANLGKALRAVQRGDRVIITSRRRAVAILAKTDIELPGESAADRKLRRLAAEGRIHLGKAGPIAPYHAPRIDGLTEQVQADRR